MYKFGDLVKIEYTSGNRSKDENFLYLKKLNDDELLFIQLTGFGNGEVEFKKFKVEDILNVENLEDTKICEYMQEILNKISYKDTEDYREKLFWLYDNFQSPEYSGGRKSLSTPDSRLSLKYLTLDEMKQYYGTLANKLVVALKKQELSLEYMNTLYTDVDTLGDIIFSKTWESLEDFEKFVVFINKQLKKDKKEKGLTSQDSSYLWRLRTVMLNGGDYRLYDRKRVKPVLFKEMNRVYLNKFHVQTYGYLLENIDDITEVYDIVVELGSYSDLLNLKQLSGYVKMDKEKRKKLLDKVGSLVDRYNNKKYEGDFSEEAILEKYYEKYPHRKEKELQKPEKKVDASKLFN